MLFMIIPFIVLTKLGLTFEHYLDKKMLYFNLNESANIYLVKLGLTFKHYLDKKSLYFDLNESVKIYLANYVSL